ncbi:hypothetical protein [Shewanella waksmanii]|uniref:hypothetical protein n=1 Tax=Shewanella waksmanii TaxID=213783 RepID=UPI0037366B05
MNHVKAVIVFSLSYLSLILLGILISELLVNRQDVGLNIGALIIAVLITVKFRPANFYRAQPKIYLSCLGGAAGIAFAKLLSIMFNDFAPPVLYENIAIFSVNFMIVYFTIKVYLTNIIETR